MDSIVNTRPLDAGVSLKKVLIALFVLAVITGGALSWFASTNPDGLEWSIEKVFGKPELPGQEHGVAGALKGVQEKTAFLPDYNFKQDENAGDRKKKDAPAVWPSVEGGTSVAGIVGAVIVMGLSLLVGFGIKSIRRRH